MLLSNFHHPSDDYFSQIASLFKEYHWLLKFKWTEIFTDDVISSVPRDWQIFLDKLDANQLRKMMIHNETDLIQDACPTSLKNFINKCNDLAIRLRWPSFDIPVDVDVREHRTSVKKINEVKHVSEIMDEVLRKRFGDDLPVIIDIGCGLGYLTKKLSSKGYKLIGIDARGDLCVKASSNDNSSQFVEMFIDDSPECLNTILSLIPPNKKAVLIGLHSCGDLLQHIISLFSKSSYFVGFFCVTCCYHKIDENKFPRSLDFRIQADEQSLEFNPVILRVGTQRTPISWCHELSETSLDAHTKSASFRGILQEVIESKPFTWKKQRSKMRLHNNFSGYIEQVIKGFKAEEREEARRLLETQTSKRSAYASQVRSLKILQTIIQPVVESAIVYDHLKHLKEIGLESYAIQSFSQIISPRNLLVISMKNDDKELTV